MANTLTEEQVEELREVFALFDKNQDGFIDSAEFKDMMRFLGQENVPQDVNSNEGDVEDEVHMDLDEFIGFVGRKMKLSDSETVILETFRKFDLNGDGVINMEELKQVLRALDINMLEYELEEMMMQADRDGNGLVEYEEFVRMMITSR